jgi:hypothetical protein
LSSSSSAGPSSPSSSPSSTLHHGEWSNLSNYTASELGASSADVTLSRLVNTACSSNCSSSSNNPPSRTGSGLIPSPLASNDHGSSTAVASHSHHKGCPHSSARQPDLEGYDDYFFSNYGGSCLAEGGPFPCYRGAGLSFRTGSYSYGDCPPHRYREFYGGPSFHHRDVPPFVFPHNGVPVAPDLGPHAASFMASSLGYTGGPLGSLLHMTTPPPPASNISMSSSTVSG